MLDFEPLEDEVALVDSFIGLIVDEDGKLFKRIVLWCLRITVPRNFCL